MNWSVRLEGWTPSPLDPHLRQDVVGVTRKKQPLQVLSNPNLLQVRGSHLSRSPQPSQKSALSKNLNLHRECILKTLHILYQARGQGPVVPRSRCLVPGTRTRGNIMLYPVICCLVWYQIFIIIILHVIADPAVSHLSKSQILPHTYLWKLQMALFKNQM